MNVKANNPLPIHQPRSLWNKSIWLYHEDELYSMKAMPGMS